jgi:hypothetical protein
MQINKKSTAAESTLAAAMTALARGFHSQQVKYLPAAARDQGFVARG